MRYKLLKIGVFFLSCYSTGYSQDSSSVADRITTKLKIFLSAHNSEKVCLQFDKPYYVAGDTIYFKAYVTIGERHLLSELSGVLHVELINTANKTDRSLLLQLTSGVTWGDFTLPDSLPQGNYHIRAYTQWMRNEGNDSFFDKDISIGSVQATKVSESASAGGRQAKPDLQFFPEGGSLITGMPFKIAFKAIGANGRGMNVNGTVTDNTGKEISKFSSAHLGMGYFYLQPEEGKTYTANVVFADGSKDVLKLPVAESSGISLSINNDSLQAASVKIMANRQYFEANVAKEYLLVIYSGGLATTVKCQLDSAVIKLAIIKRRLRTGVATVTLFSPSGEPLCERLLFIQNYDQLNITNPGIMADYARRGKMSIRLNILNRSDSASFGHFSVSVTDEKKVPVNEADEGTILSNLLLTYDLKGKVEQPNYYFTDVTIDKLKQLDLVMLTHGYRKFTWRQVLRNTAQMAIQPEKALQIAGSARMIGGKPLVKGSVSLIAPFKSFPLLRATTDARGNFKFKDLMFPDSTKFILQAVNAKDNNNTEITYHPGIPSPNIDYGLDKALQKEITDRLEPYLKNAEKQQELANLQGIGKGRMLREVKIKGSKLAPVVISKRFGIVEQTLSSDNILFGGKLTDRLMGNLRGITFVNGQIPFTRISLATNGAPMKIVVDDFEQPDDFDINSISTALVGKIETIIDGTPLHRGIMIITLQHGAALKDISSKGILPITAIGFYKAKEFYSPKYEHAELIKTTDLRSTIYWNPELRSDKNGNVNFEYYNADGTGEYRIVIEGIDTKGNLGSRVFHYKVK